jgi:hypothetical protein
VNAHKHSKAVETTKRADCIVVGDRLAVYGLVSRVWRERAEVRGSLLGAGVPYLYSETVPDAVHIEADGEVYVMRPTANVELSEVS